MLEKDLPEKMVDSVRKQTWSPGSVHESRNARTVDTFY